MLDILKAYCVEAFPNWQDLQVSALANITSGWESEIYSFDVDFILDGKQQKRGLILRLYSGASGSYKAMHEYEGIRLLSKAGYPVPEVLSQEDKGVFIGKPFIIEERIEGTPMATFLFDDNSPKQLEILGLFSELYVRLHRLDWRIFAPEMAPGLPNPYTIIDRWLVEAHENLARFGAPPDQPVLHWLEERRDTVPCHQPAVIHGDFHPSNILIREDGSPVVIDWTGLSVSDPRFDLAWTLVLANAYGGMGWRGQILHSYELQAGSPVAGIDYFEVTACARRLFDILISLSVGADKMGMQSGAEEHMRQQTGPALAVYRRLQDLIGTQTTGLEMVLDLLG